MPPRSTQPWGWAAALSAKAAVTGVAGRWKIGQADWMGLKPPKPTRQVEVSGATVREVLDDLVERHPTLGPQILANGGVAPFVNVYLGGEDVRTLDGLDTPVPEGETLILRMGGADVARVRCFYDGCWYFAFIGTVDESGDYQVTMPRGWAVLPRSLPVRVTRFASIGKFALSSSRSLKNKSGISPLDQNS